MPDLTRYSLTRAREEDYSDQEIALHISEGRDDIKNAMEEGYSLDEIADYLSGKQVTKEKAKQTEEGKEITGGDIAKMGIGTVLDIAISEGGKLASTALGATIGTVAGSPTGPGAVATGGAGGMTGYGLGAPFFGALGSAVNQYINTGEVNPAVTAVDAATNLIPFGKVRKAGDVVTQVSKFLSKAPIKSAVATGTFSGLANTAARDISTNEDIKLKDYLIGGGLGGGGTAAFLGVATATGKLYNKFKNKSPAQLTALADSGDADAIELVDTLTAGLDPENLRITPTNFTGSVGDYITNATRTTKAQLTPSYLLGFEATSLAKEAKAGVEAVKGTATNLGKQIDSYLEVNPQYRNDAIAFLDGEERPNLPPELLNNLIFGRNKIRVEQQRMIDANNNREKLLPEGKAEIIEASLNRGDYLTRAYKFFQDASYKPTPAQHEALRRRLTTGLTDEMKADRMQKFIGSYKMPREEAEAIRRFHGIPPGGEGKSNAAYQKDLKASSIPSKERLAAFQKTLDKEKLTDAQANEYLATLQSKMKGNPEEFSLFMQGDGTPKVLRQRKVISQELEDYLGLITEPGQRVGTTMSVLNRINEYNESDARIAKALFNSGEAIKVSDPRASTQGLVPLNLKRGEMSLDGEMLLVDPNIQTAVNKIYAGKIDKQSEIFAAELATDIYETAVSAYKSIKILGNISSYLIQAPSNFFSIVGGGLNPLRGLKEGVKISLGEFSGTKIGGLPGIKKYANKASPKTLQKFEDRKKRGMVTGEVAYEDLKGGLQGKRFGRIFKKITNVPGKIYSFPDNLGRNIVFSNSEHVLKNIAPTAMDEQIKKLSARLTTRTYPNYDSLSTNVKTLSRIGAMPQFVLYTLEFARSQIEQAKVIRELMNGTLISKLGDDFGDIPVNKAAMKKEGAKRLVAMTISYAAASYGLNQFNRQFLTKKEENAFRETVAADYEGGKPLAIKRNKDGTFNYVNTSAYLPQTILTNPIMAILQGENPEESTDNFLNVLQTELVGEGSFAIREIMSAITNRDIETGNKISNATTKSEFLKDIAKNLGEGLIPSTVTALARPDKTTEEKLIRQAGLRLEKKSNADGFGFKARDIHESVGNIKSTISGHQYALKEGRITPEKYEGLVAGEQRNYAGNMDKMLNHVKNLRILGESDETIIPMLKDAKFSSIDTLNLIEGKNIPFDPTKEKTTSEMLDEITGKDDIETQKNIRKFVKENPMMEDRIMGAYKDRVRGRGIILSPRESLLAGLPTNEKVKRLFPEIQSSRDPQAEIKRLVKKKILTETDVKAIVLMQRSLKNE
jgi:hypothetical protein